jgi:hypothetical protein
MLFGLLSWNIFGKKKKIVCKTGANPIKLFTTVIHRFS